MKKKIIAGICIAVVAILSFLAFAPLDFGKNDGSKWMSGVSDSLNINQLSLPGTHDSGATHSIGDVAGKCQSLAIGEQLRIGVRFFDIRLQLRKDSLHVVHSFVDQKLTFSSVIKDFNDFLTANPTEFLIVSIKEDADDVDSTVEFEDAVKTALESIADKVNFSTELPTTVGQARGKIHLISRFYSDFGFNAYSGWRDSTSFELGGIFVQDNYCIMDEQVKIDDIKKAFEKSATNSYGLVLNFTSCYLDYGFPPTYAATPARVINEWLVDNLDSQQGCLGVVVSDFVTSELVEKIYRRNYL